MNCQTFANLHGQLFHKLTFPSPTPRRRQWRETLSTSTSRLSTSRWTCRIKTIILQYHSPNWTSSKILDTKNSHFRTDRSKVAVVKLPSPDNEAPWETSRRHCRTWLLKWHTHTPTRTCTRPRTHNTPTHTQTHTGTQTHKAHTHTCARTRHLGVLEFLQMSHRQLDQKGNFNQSSCPSSWPCCANTSGWPVHPSPIIQYPHCVR